MLFEPEPEITLRSRYPEAVRALLDTREMSGPAQQQAATAAAVSVD